MTHLVNDPVDFPVELVDGFTKANSRYVKKVYGGVVRATKSAPGKVSIINGGGTGHYPGFMGWVGPGLVDGAGMTRGSNAAAEIAHELVKDGAGAQTTLVGAGARWAEQAGGASGALWGAALTAAGNALGDENEVDLKAQVKAVDAFVNSIMGLGGATVGDKTMIDAQVPFAKEFERCASEGHSAADSWKLAAGVSVNAANATTNLVAKMGRARVLGDKSLGSADPGAISFSLIVSAIGNML